MLIRNRKLSLKYLLQANKYKMFRHWGPTGLG
jgi:hypothetical protein